MANLPCPPELWERFSTLLDLAMDVPEPERQTWLDSLAGNDAAVKPWLARVLGSQTDSETKFLRPPAAPAPEETFHPGALIGPYRLEARLGEGGMGEVWRASRFDDGPQRVVALKLPHADLLGRPFRQRFARERDVLAALSHPHIAQIYDAGLGIGDHPFLALELVHGQPITDACRAEHANLHRRIALVVEVLDALTYAHQRLIVHRDIKPSNVMVTPQDGVKLLDFGIAKLLQPDEIDDSATDRLPLTGPAGQLATPGYGAPEQFSGGAITAASDTFAVGVLLFELCTGTRPFGSAWLGPNTPEAPLASTRADAAACGAPEGHALARALRGDIDAVIARATDLDPARRYGSAEAFARDLRRCLDGRPVSARRVGWATRARKFARRNKLGVGLAAVLVLTVVLGTAGIAWQARRAEAQAARATAIKDYIIGLFDNLYPRGGKPNDRMTAKELLDIGADRADAAFAHDPSTEIELLNTLQNIYDVSDDADHAEKVGMRRLELQRLLYGPNDPRVLSATVDLAVTQVMYLDSGQARTMLEQIRTPLFASTDPESLPRALWLFGHASSLRGVHGARDEALAEDQDAIRIFEAHYPRDPHYPDALMDLNGYLREAERFADALRILERHRTVATALGQFDEMAQLQFELQQGNQTEAIGRLAEADTIFRAAQDRAERLVGRQSTWFAIALVNRALLANQRGDREQAMALFAQALPLGGSRLAATGFIVQVGRAFGSALAADGAAAASIPYLEAGLAQEKQRPREEYTLRQTQSYLGDAYDQLGQTEKARPLLQAAYAEWVRYGAPAGARTLAARERWARFQMQHGNPAAATTECNAILATKGAIPSAPAALAQSDLARLALYRGDAKAADSFSKAATTTLAAITLEYDVRTRIDVWLARAEALQANGDPASSRPLTQQALTAAEHEDAPESAQLSRARELLAKN